MNFLDNFRNKHLVKVVTGIRRCGKSTLLEMYREQLLKEGVSKDNIIAINFEEPEYWELDTYKKVYEYINQKLQKNSMNYVFLDEVQIVPKFQKAVDGLFLKKNCDLYITGSNALLLSGELATLLTGRYVEIHLLPFSFKEYCSVFPNSDDYLHLFRNYLEYSAFPYVSELNNNKKLVNDYLSGIYNTVLVKDIVSRRTINNVPQLEAVIRFLADNIGNLISVKKIADTMTSSGRKISAHTVDSYLESLCDSFIFYKTVRFDIKGKQYLKSGEKYYICDIGLRNLLLGNKYTDRGFILENIIYLELVRRGYSVFVGKAGENEVDFVAQGLNGTEYFQVCESMHHEETRQRELRALEAITDHNPKTVITLDDEAIIDYNGIKQIYALDWLLK